MAKNLLNCGSSGMVQREKNLKNSQKHLHSLGLSSFSEVCPLASSVLSFSHHFISSSIRVSKSDYQLPSSKHWSQDVRWSRQMYEGRVRSSDMRLLLSLLLGVCELSQSHFLKLFTPKILPLLVFHLHCFSGNRRFASFARCTIYFYEGGELNFSISINIITNLCSKWIKLLDYFFLISFFPKYFF